MDSESILVTFAHSYLSGPLKSMAPDDVSNFDCVIQDFIDGKISYHDAQLKLHYVIDINNCLEKLKAILEVDEAPLPENPDVIGNLDGSKRKKTRTWSTNEDNRLIMGVHKFGLENWNVIAAFVGNSRTRSQCSQRWLRVLDPKISRDHFTKEEDQQLLKLVELYGDKMWTKVAAGMGNRSDVQCRYRYKQLPHKIEKPIEIPAENVPIIPTVAQKQSQQISSVPIYGHQADPIIRPYPNPKFSSPHPPPIPSIIIPAPVPSIPSVQIAPHQIHPIPAVQSMPPPLRPPAYAAPTPIIQPSIMGPQVVQHPILPMIQQATPTVNFALPPIQAHIGDGKNLSLDAPIPLRNSMDIFKSDSLFDSSFWT